jgi:TfoX/Sxy family transcriptional regulator of competence genes
VAYDEKLADRIRTLLAGRKGLNEREMFGGIGFTIDGKMVAGVHQNELMVRAPAEEHSWIVREPGARVFEMKGRPMKGWYLVGSAGTAKGPSLKKWVERSTAYVATLPAKQPMKKKAAPKRTSGARRGTR